MQRRGTQQVFFDDGQGFRESLSHREFIDKPYEKHRYRIPLPDGLKLLQIRFDPADTEGWVQMHRFEHKPAFRAFGKPLFKQGLPSHGVESIAFDPQDRIWTITSQTGETDPHLVIHLRTDQESEETLAGARPSSVWWILCALAMAALIVASGSERLLRSGMWKLPFRCLTVFGIERLLKLSVTVLGIAVIAGAVLIGLSEKPVDSQKLRFEWKGYAPEFLRLDYDLGDGFLPRNTRLYWNRNHLETFSVDFRLPEQDYHRLRLEFPTAHAKESGNESATISNMTFASGNDTLEFDLSPVRITSSSGALGEIRPKSIEVFPSGTGTSIQLEWDLKK